MKCAECRLWNAEDWQRSSPYSQDAECRRHPPRIGAEGKYYPIWPHTKNTDFCGEFRPNKPTP